MRHHGTELYRTRVLDAIPAKRDAKTKEVRNFVRKKTEPSESRHRRACLRGNQNGYLAPEIKEGLVHHHNPSSQNGLSTFLFGFLLGLFLGCHRHLLLEFHRWAFRRKTKHAQAEIL